LRLALCLEGLCQGLCSPEHILVAHIPVDAEKESTRTPQFDPCGQIQFHKADDVGWPQLCLEVLECSSVLVLTESLVFHEAQDVLQQRQSRQGPADVRYCDIELLEQRMRTRIVFFPPHMAPWLARKTGREQVRSSRHRGLCGARQHLFCPCIKSARQKIANLHELPSGVLQFCPDDILTRDPHHPEHLFL
jgi:hypothetical protein